MKKNDGLIKVFTGTESNALLLKKKLEEAGVPAVMKNDSGSAFLGSTPHVIDLYIKLSDLESVQKMLKAFLSKNMVS